MPAKSPPDLHFVGVGAGRLALTHQPKKMSLPGLRDLGITHVISLLTEREEAKDLGMLVTRAGMTWIWCPLEPRDTTVPMEAVREALEAGNAVLAAGGTVIVHCSSGIHRTGMFGYALLRVAGLDRPSAWAKVAELRAIIAKRVGADLLAWGDDIAARLA